MNLSIAMLNAVQNGGGTFKVTRGWVSPQLKFKPVEFQTGYMVAVADGLDNEYVLYADTIERFVIEHGLIDNPTQYLGLWQDDETGDWSIDVVSNELDMQTAYDLAELYNQKAIWSCSSKRALTV